MKKRTLTLLLALVLALALCLPAAAEEYDRIYDETDALGSSALADLGEVYLPAACEQMTFDLRVDVLTDLGTHDSLYDAAAYIYMLYDYGLGETHRGASLTLLVEQDAYDDWVLADDGWCVYVGGEDEALADDQLEQLLTEAVAPYMRAECWSGDPEQSAQALYHAAAALCSAAQEDVSPLDGADAPETEPDAETAYVYDPLMLLSDTEREALDAQAAALAQRYGCGVYAVLADDYTQSGCSSVTDAARQLYEDGGLGVGGGQDGILLLLSLNERDYALYCSGETAEYAFGDDAREQLSGAFLGDLGNDDWAGGIESYITACGTMLEQAANGEPVAESPVKAVLIAIGVSCVIALIVCLALKSKMRSVRRGAEASAYVTERGLTLTGQYDNYTHTTETRRVIEKSSSGGSGGGSGGSSSGKF